MPLTKVIYFFGINATGLYPPGLIYTVTLLNSTSTDYVQWTGPVDTTATFIGPTGVSGASLTYDLLQFSLVTNDGAQCAIQTALNFAQATITSMTFPACTNHLTWYPDEVAQKIPADIADSMAVTAASIKVTNISPEIQLNGQIYMNRFYPWAGYGVPDGITLADRIVNYNAAFLSLDAKTGAYSFLPPQAMPYKMIGTTNKFCTRGYVALAIRATQGALGGQQFKIERNTHYNVGTTSQLLSLEQPFSDYAVMWHISRAILSAPIGSENPNHAKFAADILKKISNFASSDAMASLCKALGILVPRASNAIDLGRDFVAQSTGAASKFAGAFGH